MTGILLRCVYNYRLFYKKATCNTTRTRINFVTWRSNKRCFYSQRNLSPIINEQEVMHLELSDKLSIANDYIKMHHFLFKKHVDSIINLIDKENSVSRHEVRLLLQWCNAVIDCLPSEKVELMESLWSILTICYFKKCIDHYNVRLKIYIENEYDFSPHEMIMEIKNESLSPTNSIYLNCMKYYCMKGNVNEALILMKNMKLQNIAPESAYNLLMLGYSQSGDVQALYQLISIMKQEGITLTSESYAPILYAYAKINKTHEIIEVIKRCNSNNIHFTNKHILNIIYILAINKHKEDINTMFGYLRKKILVSPPEINIILKLANCFETHVAVTALSHISADNKFPQFNNIIELILKQAVDNSQVVNDVTTLCMASQSNVIFKKLLSTALGYALQKGSKSCLPLLKTYKYYSPIKPHFFWPLLVKEADQYNVLGIVNILQIMLKQFNVLPCIDTIVDYVLPFTFGGDYWRLKCLRKCKIPDIMIHNSYVKFLLKKKKLKLAVAYIHTYRTRYYYQTIAHDLRQAFLHNNDVPSFVYITCNLVEYPETNSNHELVPECIDKQMRDYMIDFPGCKAHLIKILKQLQAENLCLSNETVRMITNFLNGYTTDDVTHVLQSLVNKNI